jgi:response regulator of citrate/malate metabolism
LKNALIVANKPWVASLYESYINSVGGFKVIGKADDINIVKEFCKNNIIDLILLDVRDNLRFMKELKILKITAKIIPFISFRKMKNIDLCLNLGMVNYIIKPFEYKDFKNVIENYTQKSVSIRNNLNNASIRDSLALELSLSKRTLDRVNEFMKINNRFLTSAEIGQHLKLSKTTIQKYLRYLHSIGKITKKLYQDKPGKAQCYYIHVTDKKRKHLS